MSFGSFQRGFLVSGLVFFAGLAITTSFYLKLLESENPPGPLEEIPIGKQRYVLQSEGRCFGQLDIDLHFDNQYELKASGWMSTSFQKRELRTTLQVDSGFNSLGQLVGFFGLMRFGGGKIVVGLQEVHPIQFELNATVRGRKIGFKKEFPGPIVLRENSDGQTARLSHFLLRKVGVRSQLLEEQPFLKKLHLEIRESEAGCSAEDMHSLPLDVVGMDVMKAVIEAQRYIQEFAL